jgi:hypothetical protein
MSNFTGSGSPLTEEGFAAASGMNGIDGPTLWAVLSVETSGCGFLADRRPKILFERHIFCRLTGGKFDQSHPDVSAKERGGYGDGGAHQYLRLDTAIQLDASSALKSASWGLGQIMGENFRSAGFQNVEGMVDAMVASEDGQLKAVAAFIKTNGMDEALRNSDWAAFAKRYNGPAYAENKYDVKLQTAYDKYKNEPPDLRVRATQAYLTYKGYTPGPIDGLQGDRTTKAVKAYQTANGMPVTGMIDDQLLSSLAKP